MERIIERPIRSPSREIDNYYNNYNNYYDNPFIRYDKENNKINIYFSIETTIFIALTMTFISAVYIKLFNII